VGGLAFLLLVWLPGLAQVGDSGDAWSRAGRGFGSRLRTMVVLAAVLGAISAATAVVMEGAEAAGVSGFSAPKGAIVRETPGTKFGPLWGLAVLAWLAAGILATTGLRRPADRRPAWPTLALLAVPLVFVVLVPALSGHGSTQSPVALNFPVNVVHVTA